MDSIIELLLSTLRVSTPLIFAAMGGLLSERSGVVHIALEGFLLIGAFSAATAAYFFHSPWIGAAVAMAATAVFALIYGILVIFLRCEQIVAGTAMNFLAFGLTPLLCKAYFDSTGATPSLEMASRFHSEPLYAMVIVVGLIHFWLNHYRQGLRLTVAGEKPEALATAGISVHWVRMKAVILSGVLAGFGGATLSLYLSSSFSKGMTAGRGFMALAALIFGKWKPIPTLLGCLFFGLADALQIRLQGASFEGVVIPVQFIQILPYIVTIIVLAGWVGKSRAPRALGRPFIAGFIGIIFMSGLSGCSRQAGAAPVIEFVSKSQLTTAEKEEYFYEMRSVIFGDYAPEKLDEEDAGLLHAWKSGASLEGVYHGMILGKRYRHLEEKYPTAQEDVLQRFCGLLIVNENCLSRYARTSVFGLRRQLGESVIRKISEIQKQGKGKPPVETLPALLALFQRFDAKGVDLGNKTRNKATVEFLSDWLTRIFKTRGPELTADQVLWELLNRALRMVPTPQKK